MNSRSSSCCLVILVVLLLFGQPAGIHGQQSTSEPVAQELAALLDAGNRDSIAAKDPASDNEFVAALYFSGQQLLVVSGSYAAPQLLDEKIANGAHRDVYLDLQGASDPETKFFVTDLNADGLKIRRGGSQPFDSVEEASSAISFDNDWRQTQQMSEEEFDQAFTEADKKYQRILTILLSGAR